MSKEKFFQKVPPWAVGVVVVGAVALVGLISFTIWKKSKDSQKKKDGKKEVDAVKDTAATLAQAGQKPSLDNLKLQTIANQLYAALKGPDDEAAVYRAFANAKNDLDVVNLIKAFGVRDNETLSQWLTSDLNAEEIKALNDMLARKGIKYRF